MKLQKLSLQNQAYKIPKSYLYAAMPDALIHVGIDFRLSGFVRWPEICQRHDTVAFSKKKNKSIEKC